MQQELDQQLSAAVASGSLKMASAVICNSDSILYEGGAGDVNGDAVTADTVVAIHSMTKAVTGAAAMQLVEQGKLDLDAPAGEVCPYLGQAQVLEGYDDDGQPVLRPPIRPVTLRNLLTHSSGFVYDIWNDRLHEYIEKTGTASVLTRLKKSLEVPLLFEPDSEWEYGIGIDWAGIMIEEVSGMTLGQYFAEHLTGPLGMNDTAFLPTVEMAPRLATLHARTPDGLFPLPVEEPDPDAPPPEFEMGGGGLFSTARDYSRFVRMILNGGELDGVRILKPETVELMTQNQMGDLRVKCLTSSVAELSNDAEFFPGEPKSWGLTFQINETPGFTGRPAGTLMWAGLGNCYYWIDQQNDIAGMMLTQVFPFADPASLDLFFGIETEAYRSLA